MMIPSQVTSTGPSDGNDVRHIGPVAQDFHALFGLGNDDISISSLDGSGVALAAIQGLLQQNHELERRLEQLEKLVGQLLDDSQ